MDGHLLFHIKLPVVFKIFDGLNFDWLTGKHQILHYIIALSMQLS